LNAAAGGKIEVSTGGSLAISHAWSNAGLISMIVSERERVGSFGRPPKEGEHGSS